MIYPDPGCFYFQVMGKLDRYSEKLRKMNSPLLTSIEKLKTINKNIFYKKSGDQKPF